MQRLAEAERTQTALSNTTMAKMNSGGTATESEILFFRNQLKVCRFITVFQVQSIRKVLERPDLIQCKFKMGITMVCLFVFVLDAKFLPDSTSTHGRGHQ